MFGIERCTVFKLVDEIDHYTIKCVDGEVSDIRTAVNMIHQYTSSSEATAAEFSRFAYKPELLERMSARELYDVLIEIRTFMLAEVWAEESHI